MLTDFFQRLMKPSSSAMRVGPSIYRIYTRFFDFLIFHKTFIECSMAPNATALIFKMEVSRENTCLPVNIMHSKGQRYRPFLFEDAAIFQMLGACIPLDGI